MSVKQQNSPSDERNLIIDCHVASRLLSKQQDNPLSWSQRWRLRVHLLLCDMCRQFAQQLTVIRKMTHDFFVSSHDDSAGMPDDVKQRLVLRLQEESNKIEKS